MSKKKIEQIKGDFQLLMEEAVRYGQKKQKEAFTGHFFKDNTETRSTPFAKSKILNTEKQHKKKSKDKIVSSIAQKKVSDNKQEQAPKKTQPKTTQAIKKKHKSHWQANEKMNKKSGTVLDKRVDIRQLNGKSILCIGGVRSGKSDFALDFADMYRGKKAFIATMQKPDEFHPKSNANGDDNLGVTDTNSGASFEVQNENNNENNNDMMKSMYRIHTLLDSEQTKALGKLKDQKVPEHQKIAIQKGEQVHKNDEIDNFAFEIDERIVKHQKRRNESWITFEEPLQICEAIAKAKKQACKVVLIDCITLWITNLMFKDKTDEEILEKIEEVGKVLKNPPLPIILVSNEVGLGVVPDTPLGRRFRDLQGMANQILAKHTQIVIFSVSGLPLLIKG